MPKLSISFPVEDRFEVEFVKTRELVRDLSAGALRRDPQAKIIALTPPPKPGISLPRACATRFLSRWEKSIILRMQETGKSRQEVLEECARRKREQRRKEVSHA